MILAPTLRFGGKTEWFLVFTTPKTSGAELCLTSFPRLCSNIEHQQSRRFRWHIYISIWLLDAFNFHNALLCDEAGGFEVELAVFTM